MTSTNKKSPQLNRFHFHCLQGQELFKMKNAQYGNAFEAYGLLGVVCEILGAVHRLPQLVLWAPDHGKAMKEKIVDILIDIHNFSNMALMVIDHDNWDGRKDGS